MEFPKLDGQIIAVDFDGTLCVHAYPDIGAPNKELIDELIKHKENGGQLILWTCRSTEDLDKAMAWCTEQGLVFDSVNEDVPTVKNSEYGRSKSPKVFANVYLDDRAVRITVGEDKVTSLLKTYLPK